MATDSSAPSHDSASRGPVPPGAVVPPPRDGDDRAVRPEHLYKTVGLALLAAIVYSHFDAISRVLLTIYAAAILGVALNIVVGLFPAKRRWVAAGIGTAMLGLIGMALWLGVPALADQLRGLAERGPDLERMLQEWSAWLSERTGFNVRLVGSGAREQMERFFSDMDGEVIGRATGLLEVVLLPLVILIGGLYAVGKPNDRLLTPLLRAVPRDRRLAFRRLLEVLGVRIRGWVAGSLIAMLAVGALTFVVLSLLGVRYALLLGTINGLLEFIPIFGPWVGGAIAVLFTFLDSPSLALWVLVAVVGIQQVETNVITPLVMARAAEVHPFVTVFAIFFFGALFGFLGVLLALPLVILIWTAVEVLWVERAIDTDEDPIEPVVEE